MNRKLFAILAAVLFGAISIPQAEAAGGLYLGGGLGQSTIQDNNVSLDASDTAFKAFVGYRFNIIPIIDLAVEGGYTDFGKPTQSNVSFKLHGYDAAGLLIFPIGPIDLYGKVGMLSWNASGGGTSSGTDPFYGVGAGFNIWKIGIRAEYERYQIKDTDKVQMYSLNALFMF
jgi:hypothetical protein